MRIFKLLFGKSKNSVRPRPLSTATLEQARQEWLQIEQLMTTKRPSALKEAVVRADKLLDQVLMERVVGETLGERLKAACEIITSEVVYQGLWEAHKVRNALVHEAGYDPTYLICQRALAKFQRGLEALGVHL